MKGIVRKIGFVVCVVAVLFNSSCTENPVIEVPITAKPTQKALGVNGELLSMFDMLDDFTSTNNFTMKKGDEIVPANVQITFIDQSFTDGDGIEVEIDFGSKGSIEPYGVLCQDGVYRAGKLSLHLSSPYSEVNSLLTVNSSESNSYMSGNGASMTPFIGSFEINRLTDSSLLISSSDLKSKIDSSSVSLDFSLTALRTSDFGAGILDDEVEFTGTSRVTDATESVLLEITEPLLKKYTKDCAKNIVAGEVAVSTTSISDILVDFDPADDQACDKKVSITFARKTIQTTY